MDRRRSAWVLAAAVMLVLGGARPALAAPQRLSADPEPGAELHEAPEEVRMSFSEPLGQGSDIRVTDECKRRLDDGNTVFELNEMWVALPESSLGTIKVTYVAEGVTGATRDSYTFTVLHGAKSCDGSGGGHGGHGGGGDGGGGSGGGGGHGGHGGGSDDSGDSGGHAGHDDSGSATDHDDHVMSSAEHDDHGGATDHKKHAKSSKHNKHRNHKQSGGDQDGGGVPPQAFDDQPIPEPGPLALFGALGLATVFGVLGGWVLRVSGPS